MVKKMDKTLTRRANLAVVGGLVLLPLLRAMPAAGQPSEQDMLNALTRRRVRAPGATDPAPVDEERDFIRALGHRSVRSITEEDRGRLFVIARDRPNIDLEINFDFNSSVISPNAISTAVKLGRTLVNPQLKGVVCLVGGHTDGRGSDAYNLDLSRRRAEAIKAFLVESFGVPATNLIAVGFGKEHLKNPGNPFADENRRVQVVNMLEPE